MHFYLVSEGKLKNEEQQYENLILLKDFVGVFNRFVFDNAKSAIDLKRPKDLPLYCIKVYTDFVSFVTNHCRNSYFFHEQLRMSMTKILRSHENAALFFAEHVDEYMRKSGSNKMEVYERMEVMRNTSALLKFLDEKDIFMSKYTKQVQIRLLRQDVFSFELEDVFLQSLKVMFFFCKTVLFFKKT